MENSIPDIKNFFPATTNNFRGKCGAIESLSEADFLNENRRKHLLSYQQSWNEWAAFEITKKPHFIDPMIVKFVDRLVSSNPSDAKQLKINEKKLRREMRIAPSKSHMLAAYEALLSEKKISNNATIDRFLIKKIVRTHSGVLVITVLTSPGRFSCAHDCHYCPNEPGQPRSYLSTEPAVLRANQNGWDAAAQFWDRAVTLHNNGHTIDKIEVLVLGGTWSGYPKAYQEEFIRDLFYAANTFYSALKEKRQVTRTPQAAALTQDHVGKNLRSRMTLEEEQIENRTASCRIIGLTLETRPDSISPGEIKRLRRFGCTRVQIGIQHSSDDILAYINRGCFLRHAIRAIRLLKDACFKVDIHLMPDLPGSSVECDKQMFEDILSSTALQADQWKIYPCEITPFSTIETLYKEKKFVPYAEKNQGSFLVELLLKVKLAVHPWIRLNRVVRDIPNPSIIAGNNKTNLRQILLDVMKKNDLFCRCLRCREITTKDFSAFNISLKIRQYPSFGGQDFFLSFETNDEKNLFGFLRLRIRESSEDKSFVNDPLLDKIAADDERCQQMYYLDTTFPELQNSALIRELHVYGLLVGSNEQKDIDDSRPQHTGIGKKLLATAEMIALTYNLKKVSVIAGVGTTEYYRKQGYTIENHYMVKYLKEDVVYKSFNDLHLTLPLNIQQYSLETKLGDFIQQDTDKNDTETTNYSESETLSRIAQQRNHIIGMKRYPFLLNNQLLKDKGTLPKNKNQKKICSAVGDKSLLPSCCLCDGKKKFEFVPTFPACVESIARKFNLYTPQKHLCPFCTIQHPQVDYCKQHSIAIKQEKFETNHNRLTTWFGLERETFSKVSPYWANFFIRKHGYPPSLVFPALAEHSTNTLLIRNYLDTNLIEQVESLQFRIQQNRSHEENAQEKIIRSQTIDASIQSGDLQELKQLYPDYYTSLLKIRLMRFFLFPHTNSAQNNSTLCNCFCGHNSFLINEQAIFSNIILFLQSYLLHNVENRRLQMFRTLQLLKKCEKWYQKPAIEYSKKWRNHFLVRLEFLDWCITMNQYQFYTSLPCQDWEDFVNANCSKAVLFYQHCISSLLLLYTWVQDEYQRIQNEIFLPDFHNTLAIPFLFRNDTDYLCQQPNISLEDYLTKNLQNASSCCISFITSFINPVIWMNTSISFWTLEGTYQPETAKAERNSDSTFEEVIFCDTDDEMATDGIPVITLA